MNISQEFAISLIIQLLILAFFIGIYVATLKFMGKSIEDINQILKDDKKEIKDTLKADKQELKDEMSKYNNMLERMIIVEQSTKAAHHREDELNLRVTKLEQK